MKRIFLLVFFLQLMGIAFAQVSDEQVVNMLQSARQQGMGQQEMLIMLTQKGVTQEQLMRIKNNYGKTSQQGGTTGVDSRMRTQLAGGNQDGAHTIFDTLGYAISQGKNRGLRKNSNVFGRNVFNNDLLTFEPNLNIATPENYILGPGDEVIIDIWGDSKQTLRQKISPEGTIVDAQVGPIFLSGISVKEANARLKSAYANIYSTMNGANPTTFMNMSLGEIRSIRVNVMGEVAMPGTYTLSSLASLFHAIYSAGGVNNIGSLRSVKISRGGKQLADVDVYEYLLNGKSDIDIRLEDGDVVIVSPYRNLITIRGKVKRPMAYEMKDNESVGQLLDFAGGFTGDAYKKAVRIIRKSGREYQVYNVEEPDFNQFLLTDGDQVSIDSVLNRFENRVEIRGAVYRSGLYALGDDMSTIKQLIEKSEGLRGDAFLNRAVLNREKPDRTREILSVDIKGLLENKVSDIELRNNDVLYIPSIFDLKEDYTISVSGAVGYPGTYKYADGMTIEDVIIQAGGLKESASVVKIDVSRRIKNPKSLDVSTNLAENFTLTLKDGFIVDGDPSFTLLPFDEIFIRNSPGYQKQQSVSIHGEVLFDGEYVLSKKGERLSDLVKKAGGLTPEAYVTGARLVRRMNQDERARVESLLKLSRQSSNDSIDVSRLDIGNTYYVGIELSEALQKPGSEYDVVLREGDVLHVPEYNGTVKISGAVMYPNTVVFKKGANLKYYIEQGGGFASRAKKRKVFIVYMNGTVSKSRTFAKAKVAPGCEVIVPIKPPRKGVGLAEIMGIATSTTSMAALVTSIINSTK